MRVARKLTLACIFSVALTGQALAQRPIAVTETSGKSKQTLYLMYPDGSQKVGLYTAANLGKPALSPNGGKVAFHDGSCRCMVLLSYNETASAVTVTGKISVPDGADGAFSPDGQRIAYTHSTIGRMSMYSLATNTSQVLFADRGAYAIAWLGSDRLAYAGYSTADGASVTEVKLDASNQVVEEAVVARDFAFEGLSAARTRNSLFAGFVSTRGGTPVVREINLGAPEVLLGDAQVLPGVIVTGSEPVPSPTDQSVLYKVPGTQYAKRLDLATGVTRTISSKAKQFDWRSR